MQEQGERVLIVKILMEPVYNEKHDGEDLNGCNRVQSHSDNCLYLCVCVCGTKVENVPP